MKDSVGGAGERRTEESAGAIHHAETIFKANLSAGMIKHKCLPPPRPPPRPEHVSLNKPRRRERAA